MAFLNNYFVNRFTSFFFFELASNIISIYTYIYGHVLYYMLQKEDFRACGGGAASPLKSSKIKPKLNLEGGTRTQRIETEGKQAEQCKEQPKSTS